jgi:hypothetical protein
MPKPIGDVKRQPGFVSPLPPPRLPGFAFGYAVAGAVAARERKRARNVSQPWTGLTSEGLNGENV